MNKRELIQLLEVYISRAISLKDSFNKDMVDLNKKVLAQDFQECIFKFLDFLYTNFPTDRSRLDEHFPRPHYHEKEAKYKKRVSKFQDSKNGTIINVPEIMQDFLWEFYRINKRLQYPMSLLDGIVKHETLNDFGDNWIIEIGWDLLDTSQSPSIDSNGTVSFGGVRIDASCKNLTIGSVKNINGETILSNLRFDGKPDERDKISLRGNKILFLDWANKSIKALEESLAEFQKIKY